MKKLLFLAFLAVGMTANAETVANNDDDEEQIENKGGIELGKGKDEDDRWSMHFAFGVDIPTGAPSGVEFAPFRSWEINWTVVQYDYTPGNLCWFGPELAQLHAERTQAGLYQNR